MNSLFGTFTPAPSLQPYVHSYWRGRFNLASEKFFSQTVLPNGCIELIIHCSDEHCALSCDAKSWAPSPEFTLVGLYDTPYEVKFSAPVEVFGIRFYPDGIRNVFGLAPSSLGSTYEDGATVLGRQLREFGRTVKKAGNLEEKIELADAFLIAGLHRHRRHWDYTHQAMVLIRKQHGLEDHDSLRRQIPISARQLQREFKQLYGISITDYMRISRMNAIHQYMLSQNKSLTQASCEHQFTDQSHFIREFKRYVGIAPGKFCKSRSRFIVNPA